MIDTKASPARWAITLRYNHTNEDTPDNYSVIRVVNSLDYTPGHILTRQDVEYIFASGGWEMIVQ